MQLKPERPFCHTLSQSIRKEDRCRKVRRTICADLWLAILLFFQMGEGREPERQRGGEAAMKIFREIKLSSSHSNPFSTFHPLQQNPSSKFLMHSLALFLSATWQKAFFLSSLWRGGATPPPVLQSP